MKKPNKIGKTSSANGMKTRSKEICRILLVEDNQLLSEEVADILTRAGFRVTEAINAIKALERLPVVNPDLIITDLDLPWLDGFKFIEHLRTLPQYQNLPIVILSANGSTENRIRGKEVGANAFIRKPCKSEELIAVILSLRPFQ